MTGPGGPGGPAVPGGPLLVGVGSLDRGDDAVGPLVARAVAARGLSGVRVLAHEDPTDLIELWSGHDPVVVVDATRAGGDPGMIHRIETGAGAPPLSRGVAFRAGGTHALGVGDAVELARALDRLPPRVVLVGIEAACFDHGAPLSAPVADAFDAAVSLAVLTLTGTGQQGPDRSP